MQKKIVLVLILMSFCVLGITGLQLYWNYQNYKTVVANFKKDANNALVIAVDREMMQRRLQLIEKVKEWMNDPAIVEITCDTNNKDHSTAFTIRDVVPYYPDEKADQVTMGISSYKEKVGKITPKAKAVFINHFATIVKSDLNSATVHYYTQGIGHRLEKTFGESKMDRKNFGKIYAEELAKRQILTTFKLNDSTNSIGDFVTQKVNTAFRRPYVNSIIFAVLENPNQFYLREMKWLIIGSLLLISITIFCFYYTIKTLLNQHKLVAIKNQFISNMTHEINTPLASIQVTTEALQQFDPEPTTRKKYLDIILYQTKKLTDLSNEILENAKLETTEFAMDERIDLVQLIKNLIADLVLENEVKIHFEDTELFIVKGNKAHLTRSIANVLENSIKYNSTESPIIAVKLSRLNSNILLNIEDNGPGIADEFKTKIFDQFYRIPTGNMHNIKGYGLGLSYVKKVITQHNGSVRVLDNRPFGTIFSINLPTQNG